MKLLLPVVILALCLASALGDKVKCITAVPDFFLKQKQINHLVDFLNKPIFPEYTSAHGVLTPYELAGVGNLAPDQPFSLFDERQWKETKRVIKYLLRAKDFEEFLHVAELLHERVNDDLLLYGLSVVLLHRNDTQGLHVPPIHKIFPDKFIKFPVIQKMKALSKKFKYLGETPIVDATEEIGSVDDPNHDLFYFTEDVGLNAHHYHWHVLYPALWKGDDLDRKGELFYWQHKQMLARYEVERLANGLPRVKPFENWNQPIEDGYAPHLVIDKLNYRFTYRPPGLTLKNLPSLSKSDMLQWKETILTAVHLGKILLSNGTKIPLNNEHGIEILGDIIEASLLSKNKDLYGNIHNYAHVMAAKITDPYDQFGGNYGVMYDVATSARDPLFYSWHKFIDNIFQEHKNILAQYAREDIEFQGVKVNSLTIKADNTTDDNKIHTFWQDSTFKVPKGFTFTSATEMYVKVRHLQHEIFRYELDVSNSGSAVKNAVVRFFLAPIYDEKHHPFTSDERRQLTIELDKFTTKLQPGKNVIIRDSTDSNLVTPWSHIFKDKYKTMPMDHCHCGIPDYLLLPKGDFDGSPFYFFAIVNDWDKDKVDQPENCHCPDSATYCGDADRNYPDTRALGFPFDRKLEGHFADFATDNIVRTPVTIKFTGEILPPKAYYTDRPRHN